MLAWVAGAVPPTAARAQEDDPGEAVAPSSAGAPRPRLAIELGAPFRDRAILQRGMRVPVWGWSAPETRIVVEFAGQRKTATAGRNGKWRLDLDPLNASAAPAEMTIRADRGNAVTLKDILVGEVWMCSGQSNMQWTASKSSVGRYLQKEIADRVAAGKEKPPVIREAQVTTCASALHPIERADAEWRADPAQFSAIAFAFAYELYRELAVPIGILNCAFSTTTIEAWIPRVGFRDGAGDHTRAVYRRMLETDPATPEHRAAWDAFCREVETALAEGRAIPAETPGNLRGNRDASWMFNGRINPMVPYALRGAIWNQGYASMGDGFRYYENLHSLVRGWRLQWNRPDLPVYFHQFYSASVQKAPSIGGPADMRFGTWLARDIPNTGMASQMDIAGGVHYFHKAVPGRRLALQALRNVYAKEIVADGPMFKSYAVKGNQLIVEFEHAEGGLVVGETGTNARSGMAVPKIIPNGEDRVELFYLAGADRVWHPAKMKIEGDRVILAAAEVREPRGVSYGTGGIGFEPNLYNRALLPMTPFIYYDHRPVTSETWPDRRLKVAGETAEPAAAGWLHEWRKMPILSTQFRENAVLQAGVPVPIWGSTRLYGEWGAPAEGEMVIRFEFGDIRKTIPVTPEMEEWRVILPPLKATSEPRTLKVSCTINGELAHERVCPGIVVGDVFYVAAPATKFSVPETPPSGRIVRMIQNESKRSSDRKPSRFSVAVSRAPDNRFASRWKEAAGLAAAIGHRVAAASGNPVGIVFMQSRDDGELKRWIPAEDLDQAPSLMEDFKELAALRPGNAYYEANARRYLADWKRYWSEYIPEMIATRRVPDGKVWGDYPTLAGHGTSTAAQTYNVMTHSFTPAALRGIIFLAGPGQVARDEGANFGPELAVLAGGWRRRFGGEPLPFIYTIPSRKLAPKITAPTDIEGPRRAVEVSDWSDVSGLLEAVVESLK